MYNIEKRTSFSTVGELKELIKNLSDDTQVCICGDSDCWFHIEEDESLISLDTEDLEECYLEEE